MRATQLEAVRAACIKANPSILCKDCEGVGYYVIPTMPDGEPEQQQCNCQEREIRLADVLLAVKGSEVYSALFPLDGYLWSEMDSGKTVKFWNLRTDDLEQQSDETIAFIHSLLGI